MDFFIEAMTNPGRRPNQNGPNQQQRPSQPRPPQHQSPHPQGNQNQGGGYNHNVRPNPIQRPSPPPVINPNITPNNPKFPPPPQSYQNPRRNHSPNPQDNREPYGQGRPQRGRFNPQRDNRPAQIPMEQLNPYITEKGRSEDQPERDQNFNRNYQRNQGNYNKRQSDYNNFQDDRNFRGDTQNDRGYRGQQQDNRGYRGAPQDDRNYRDNQNQGNRKYQDNRNDNRQQFPYPTRGKRGQPQQRQPYRNRDRSADRRQSDQRQPQQRQNQNYRGRGQPRGRTARGRGRGRDYNRQDQERQVQRQQSEQSQQSQSQSESASMSMEQSQSVSQEEQQQLPQAQAQNDVEFIREDEEGVGESEAEQSQQYEESEENIQSEGSVLQMESSGSVDMQRIDTMVSEEEYNERVQTFQMNNRNRDGKLVLDTGRSFAIFQINKRTMEPDLALALKRFRRSTNRGENEDQKDETSDCPRSKKGLSVTIRHIQKEIIDADGMRPKDLAFPLPPGQRHFEFLHIYDFLWNRMREMIKDVARLNEKDRGTQQIVLICEQMLRFFIIAIREGRLPHKCKLVLDSKMNIESITKILTQLLQIYEMAHYKVGGESQSNTYISPNQPEILGYAIIISNDLQRTINDKLRVRLNGDGLNHPLVNTQQIQTALNIKKAIKNRDFEIFYRILEAKNTDYVQACLMIHSLPAVRRQTLRVIQKACEPDLKTKGKKIPLSILKNSLRFSNALDNEFYTFLDNIGAKIRNENGQGIVELNNINQSLEDFKESFAFDFGYNKTDRQLYPDCKGKAHMVDSQKISRQELIKRSWHYGTYLTDCATYYDRVQLAQKQKPKPIKKFAIKSPKRAPDVAEQVSPPKPEQKKEATQMNLNFLMEKKKEFNRSRFLKNLESLIQILVRRSDVHSQHQRKRGIAMIVEFMEILKTVKLKETFDKIIEFNQYKAIVYEALENLSSFAKSRQKFIDSFYVGTNEWSTFRSGKKYRKLSTAVDSEPKRSLDLLAQMNKIASKVGKLRSINILVMFVSSNQFELSPLHIQFIKNIYKFLVSDKEKSDEYLDGQVQNICDSVGVESFFEVKRSTQNGFISYRLKFGNYRLDRSEPPFLCGYDKIILLDLHGEPKIFIKLMSEMQEKRKQTMMKVLGSVPKLKTTIANILVCPVDKFKQKANLVGKVKQEWSNRWHYLQMESSKLSLPLKHSIIQILTSNISEIPPQQEQYQSVTIDSLISQIKQNMQFSEGVHPYPSSLDFFQQYFKANFNFLSKTIKSLVENYELIDWTQVLLESTYIREKASKANRLAVPTTGTSLSEQKINLNSLLSKKLIFSHEIISLLKEIDLFEKYEILRKERAYLTDSGVLAIAVEEYLQEFTRDERLVNLQSICTHIIENCCDLSFKDGKIQGGAAELVSYIVNQLRKELKYLTIILPKDFKFCLNKKDFVPRYSETDKTKNVIKNSSELATSTFKHPKMLYEYGHLLNKLRRQVNTETEDTDYQKITSGSKKVKL